MTQLIHKQLSYTVRGVLIDVYNQLGPLLPEKIYQKAITYGLREHSITCTPEKQFEVSYRNISAGKYYVDQVLNHLKINVYPISFAIKLRSFNGNRHLWAKIFYMLN